MGLLEQELGENCGPSTALTSPQTHPMHRLGRSRLHQPSVLSYNARCLRRCGRSADERILCYGHGNPHGTRGNRGDTHTMRHSRRQAVHELQQRIAQGERLLKEFSDRREPETERVRSLLRAELERKRMALRAIRARRL